MLKLKMMLCVMMLPLVVVGCTSASGQSVREATTASGVDTQPPPTGRHRWIISPQREADHYAKTTGRNPEYINGAAQIGVVDIDGQLMQLL